MNTVRILGRGAFTMTTLTDFQSIGGVAAHVDVTNDGLVWDTDSWDVGLWDGTSSERHADPLHPRSIGRAFQFRIDETSSLSFATARLNESGASLEAGGWALYGIDFQFVPLGLS